MAKTSGRWIDDLLSSVGGYIHLETSDGVQREGRLSGFAMRSITINDVTIDIPTEVELNGDPNDRIPMDRISRINIS